MKEGEGGEGMRGARGVRGDGRRRRRKRGRRRKRRRRRRRRRKIVADRTGWDQRLKKLSVILLYCLPINFIALPVKSSFLSM